MLGKEETKLLKSMGQKPSFPVCLAIGKEGIGDSHVKVLDNALRAHELAKVKAQVGDAAEMKEAACLLAEKTNSEIVEIRGHTALFYRANPLKRGIFSKHR